MGIAHLLMIAAQMPTKRIVFIWTSVFQKMNFAAQTLKPSVKLMESLLAYLILTAVKLMSNSVTKLLMIMGQLKVLADQMVNHVVMN